MTSLFQLLGRISIARSICTVQTVQYNRQFMAT